MSMPPFSTPMLRALLDSWIRVEPLSTATRSLNHMIRDGNNSVLLSYELIMEALNTALPNRDFQLADYLHAIFDMPMGPDGRRRWVFKEDVVARLDAIEDEPVVNVRVAQTHTVN